MKKIINILFHIILISSTITFANKTASYKTFKPLPPIKLKFLNLNSVEKVSEDKGIYIIKVNGKRFLIDGNTLYAAGDIYEGKKIKKINKSSISLISDDIIKEKIIFNSTINKLKRIKKNKPLPQ